MVERGRPVQGPIEHQNLDDVNSLVADFFNQPPIDRALADFSHGGHDLMTLDNSMCDLSHFSVFTRTNSSASSADGLQDMDMNPAILNVSESVTQSWNARRLSFSTFRT